MLDNSINAAVEPYANLLETADNYQSVFQDETITPHVNVSLKLTPETVEIVDTAPGISLETARDHVFRFGRDTATSHEKDRLSVYGIGLKRAIFKLGNKITIRSDHIEGGFDLKLDVRIWASEEQEPSAPWTFPISSRLAVPPGKCGTSVIVTELHDEVKRRMSDGVFESQLRDSIAKTYAFYLTKFVNIEVNGKPVEGTSIEIGGNHASDLLIFGDVTCAITAGMGIEEAGQFRDKSSGWFVFCNGRAVIFADKSPLTGWGGAGLPIFQPKHRPFVGTVFFVSKDAEQLPWTTTKSAINEDSALWQMAKRQMATVGRIVVSYLDDRYTDEGTEVSSRDLREAAGPRVSVLSAAVSKKRSFEPPPKAPFATTTRVQYDAKVEDIRRIARYLKQPSMSGSDVGRHTFSYFLRNEVGEG